MFDEYEDSLFNFILKLKPHTPNGTVRLLNEDSKVIHEFESKPITL